MHRLLLLLALTSLAASYTLHWLPPQGHPSTGCPERKGLLPLLFFDQPEACLCLYLPLQASEPYAIAAYNCTQTPHPLPVPSYGQKTGIDI